MPCYETRKQGAECSSRDTAAVPFEHAAPSAGRDNFNTGCSQMETGLGGIGMAVEMLFCVFSFRCRRPCAGERANINETHFSEGTFSSPRGT